MAPDTRTLSGDTVAASDDSALNAFVLLASFLQRPVDPGQLRHALGNGSNKLQQQDLLRLANLLELRAKEVAAPVNKLSRQPMPAIAWTKDGDFFLVLQASDETALIFHPGSSRPQAVSLAKLAESYAGRIILVSTSERLAGGARSFDLSWFVPAIVKYRHLLRDVLLASFFIQILALVTPLFFQIVIDKVLVHNGLTTLEILAIGFLAVSLFDVILGGLRTYLFTHTTSRVDAELGATLFSHLARLPMTYFQARRVGDSVARVRELETISKIISQRPSTTGLRKSSSPTTQRGTVPRLRGRSACRQLSSISMAMA